MKILCVGDSWTKGFGIEDPDDTWPKVLEKITNNKVTAIAKNGWRNDQILHAINYQLLLRSYDLIIVGWSGISRNPKGWSLSYAPDEDVDSPERAKFFSKATVASLQETWQQQRHAAEVKAKSTKCEIVHFSVFGDDPREEFKLQSYLEYLANQEGIYFKYPIPIFEFDFLHENNTVTQEFAKRNFMSHWERACVEREETRLRKQKKLFLDCGHPNVEGHRMWAEYVKDTLKI